MEVNGPLITKALLLPQNEDIWHLILKAGFKGSILIDEKGIVTIKDPVKQPKPRRKK
jgi:hypothetical protein